MAPSGTRVVSLALPAGNDVKVDITVRECLACPLQQRSLLRGYDEFTDVPSSIQQTPKQLTHLPAAVTAFSANFPLLGLPPCPL
jgi:hypothetical protein